MALSGLRVLDATDMRGALCARLLGDLGADVIRIHHPDDDRTTSEHLFRNANKRGADRLRFADLLSEADVLIENSGDLTDVPDDVIHIALADFGLTGPRAGWRLEPLPAFAASSALHASGFPDMAPCWLPGFIAHDCASTFGAIGAVAAIMERRRSGVGQRVEVSVQEAAISGLNPWGLALQSYTKINPQLPVEGNRNAEGNYWVLPAKDGYVRAVIGAPSHWDGFFKVLGEPDALASEEWQQMGFRTANGDVVRIVAEEQLVDKTRSQVVEEALAAGTPMGRCNTPAEFAAEPQVQGRGFFTTRPETGDGPFAVAPWRLSATPTAIRHGAPDIGDEASFEGKRNVIEPTGGTGPLLEGVRVVEFGVAAVVPETAWQLSELGAEVIKVESMTHPDVLRWTGPTLNDGFAFNVECRGRSSVALDLTTERGRELALDLCASADIVMENNRGGVLARFGLDYDDVRARNPSVVYAVSHGYGRGGPLGEMQAFGPLNAAFSGAHMLWNHPEAPYPCGTSLNHPDHIAGKLLTVAVLAALDHRNRTGEGQLIDMAQTEAAAYLIGERYLDEAITGVAATARGNASLRAAPHDVYPSAGDDEWIAIAVHDDEAWLALARCIGFPDEPELRTVEGRLAARDVIDAAVAAWASEHQADAATVALQAAGVSAMTVQSPVDHHADPHLAAREFIVTLQHPVVGEEQHAGNPLRFSRTALRTASSAPCLGADTEAVLTKVLGLSAEEVAALVDDGVCV